MATVAAKRLTNIVSITQGDTYEGIRSVTIQTNKGRIAAILKEGNLYADGSELLGTPDFPVRTQVVFEQDAVNMLALLAQAEANLVIVLKTAGGGANQTITIANHQFESMSQAQSLQDFGRPSISGVAHSADGSTLPISAA